MATKKQIEEFLESKNLAIAGVSRDKKKFGYRVFEDLTSKGYNAYPINPNKFGFKIKEINVKASINNYYLGRLETDDVIIIPAKSNEIHNLKLRLRIANIIQGFSVFFALFKEEKLSIDIEGYIRFKSFLINKKINVKETSIINSFK